MTTIQSLGMLEMCREPTISVEADLRRQVKRSGRSQKSPAEEHGYALSWELKA